MPKLIFYGGVDIRQPIPESLRKLDQSIYSNKSILVFDLTGPLDQLITKWRPNIDAYFNPYKPADLVYASDWLDRKDKINLDNFPVVYLGGGDTKIQNEYLFEFGFDQKLPDFSGTIVGNSAGALNMCRETIITADQDVPETKIMAGLGLFDDSVEVHYVDGRNDEELLELSKGRKIYAIPEESAMIFKEGQYNFIGYAWMFENEVKKKIN